MKIGDKIKQVVNDIKITKPKDGTTFVIKDKQATDKQFEPIHEKIQDSIKPDLTL